MIGNLILRLVIWLLLTSDLSPANIMIGTFIAFILPRGYRASETLKDWLGVLGKILMAIPQAYIEAFEIILRPHNHEENIVEEIPPKRSPRLVFLDIFIITFTPKTIVYKYCQEEGYGVHKVVRRPKQL